MAECLAGRGRIEIRGFASFSLRYRPARVGRNPKTGTPVSGEYQRVWSGVHAPAMATSIRNGIHRLHDQKTPPSHPPAQIGTPHFWYSLDSMATAYPPLPRAVNFTDHLR